MFQKQWDVVWITLTKSTQKNTLNELQIFLGGSKGIMYVLLYVKLENHKQQSKPRSAIVGLQPYSGYLVGLK